MNATQNAQNTSLPGLLDIGLNLGHDSFDDDRAEVVARAAAAGVHHMIITGASLEGTRRALEVVRQWPDATRCTAGIHPHHATELFEVLSLIHISEPTRH